MKKLFKINIYTMVFALIVFTSCEDNFLDINEDPNNPLKVPTAQLITAAETNLAYTLSNGSGGLSLYTGIVVKHWVQRGLINDYGLQGTDFAVITAWQSLYAGALTDTQVAIEQGTAEEDFRSVGVAQLLRAHILTTAVDLWGVVPYSEIGQGAGNEAPAYEDGAGIYSDMLALIDVAIGNLQSDPGNVPGDLIYPSPDGTIRWIRYANSLKLRLLNNVRLTRDVSSEVGAAIAGGITDASQDFQLTYGTSFNPENRNPGFSFEWTAGNGNYIDPFFFEIMRSNDSFGHGGLQFGVQDPRIPYYFFNQLPDGSADGDAENPCAYCPSDAGLGTGFLSIYSFSFNIDPNEGFDQGRSQTLAGLYPVGGRFDDGLGGIASNSSSLLAGQVTGPGNTPQRLLDLGEVLFIRAELAQANVTAENPRDMLSDAIDASFAKVNSVASSAGAPPVSGVAYRNAVLATYDGAADPMEVIMTAKWVAQFGNSIVSYNDIRRTGYPRLHDGNTDNLSTTVQTRQFPVSLPYDIANGQLNANFPGQRVIANDRVFWDVN